MPSLSLGPSAMPLAGVFAALPPFAHNTYLTAALWIGLALVASLISIRTGISVALTEIFVGVLAGNFIHIQTTTWIDFLAGFGSVVLTFLAGAEIEPEAFRRHLKASLVIGAVGFFAPFLGAFAVAGIALSTTSVAVVYAVMVETGLNRTEIGKLILAACFVNDLGRLRDDNPHFILMGEVRKRCLPGARAQVYHAGQGQDERAPAPPHRLLHGLDLA